MRRAKPFLWASLLGLALVIQPVQAQSQISNPGIQPTGTIAVNDCVKFVNPFLVTSTGAACAGATAPGGSTTQLQYNNASAFGGISGWTTNGSTALTGGASTTLAIGGATIGTNVLAVTGTVAISGIVTGTAGFTTPGGYAGTTIFGGSANSVNGTFYMTNASARMQSDGTLNWNSAANQNTGGADLFLYRDAANTLAQRNSTTAQTLRVYNTFTDSSNYERAVADWATTANTLTLGVQAAGTGTLRAVNIVGAGVGIGVSGLTLTAGALAFPKITASASAPGAAGAKLELVCGTNAGSLKLIVAGGTSATAVTITDNIGSGATGC